MQDKKIKAYRTLLYQVLIDIKNGLNRDEKACFHVAHAFHNLALASINDFADFKEDELWGSIGFLERQFELTHYRQIYQEILQEDREQN